MGSGGIGLLNATVHPINWTVTVGLLGLGLVLAVQARRVWKDTPGVGPSDISASRRFFTSAPLPAAVASLALTPVEILIHYSEKDSTGLTHHMLSAGTLLCVLVGIVFLGLMVSVQLNGRPKALMPPSLRGE
jgi:hypothetical protein